MEAVFHADDEGAAFEGVLARVVRSTLGGSGVSLDDAGEGPGSTA